jgi:thioredoxin reductase
MTGEKKFDMIIVGGSYSGFAAGMALGKALKKVLIMDDGKLCNRQTLYLHNFITHDGKKPAEIATLAKKRLEIWIYFTRRKYSQLILLFAIYSAFHWSAVRNKYQMH